MEGQKESRLGSSLALPGSHMLIGRASVLASLLLLCVWEMLDGSFPLIG